jgi:membrane protease YdiL (CAAX protease family)
LAGVISVLAISVLFRGWSPGGGIGTAIIFALTSFVVGFREELLYRAVLINLLQPKYGVLGSLVISTVLFTVYHYGTWAISWLIVAEIIGMSVILGLIYIYSRSLYAVALLHGLYDAIWFFGPFLTSPIPDIWRPIFLLAGIAFVCLWAVRVGRIGPAILAESGSA